MENNELEKLKQEVARIDQEGQIVTNSNILFLDISSSCTGYTIGSIDFIHKKATITKAGVLWLNPDWPHPQKYQYMHSAMQTYFDIIHQIDHCVVEAYSVNPKKMSGVNVVAELQGVIKEALWDSGIKVSSVPVQTWRSQLGIKPIITTNSKGKKEREYKQPTKDYITNQLTVPNEVISNMTGNSRSTPSDLYDSMGLALGWLKKYGFTVQYSNVEFNPHIGMAIGAN